MSLPSTFSYALQKLSGFTKNKIRLNTTSATTAPANSTISVRLPINTYINLASFNMYATATTASSVAGQFSTLPRNVQSLIQNFIVRLNGQALSGSGCSQAHTAYNELMLCRGNNEYKKSCSITGLGNDVVAPPVANETRNIVIDDWPSSFMSATPRWIDTSLLGEISVDIRLAGSEIMVNSNDVTVGTYTLTDIWFEIEILQWDSPIYDEIIQEELNSGRILEIPYYDLLDTHVVRTNADRITINSQCVEMLLVTFRDANYSAVAHADKAAAANNGQSSFFKFSPLNFASDAAANVAWYNDNVHRYNFNINGKNYPEYGAQPVYLSYNSLCDSFGDRADSFNTNTLTQPAFCNFMPLPAAVNPIAIYSRYNYIVGLSFRPNGLPPNMIAGYNTLAQNGYFIFDSTNMACSAGQIISILAITRPVLKVGAGKMVSIDV